jgi:hypothetical protein
VAPTSQELFIARNGDEKSMSWRHFLSLRMLDDQDGVWNKLSEWVIVCGNNGRESSGFFLQNGQSARGTSHVTSQTDFQCTRTSQSYGTARTEAFEEVMDDRE